MYVILFMEVFLCVYQLQNLKMRNRFILQNLILMTKEKVIQKLFANLAQTGTAAGRGNDRVYRENGTITSRLKGASEP